MEKGSRVRFVTTTPRYDAEYYPGEMTVTRVYDNGNFEIRYPPHDQWPIGLSQEVHPDDVELV